MKKIIKGMYNDDNPLIVKYPLSNNIVFVGTLGEGYSAYYIAKDFIKEINVPKEKAIVTMPNLFDGISLKSAELDIRLSIIDKMEINIEMQNYKPDYDIHTRLLYYLGKLISVSVAKNSNYLGKSCYVLAFLNFELYNDDICIHEFVMKDDTNIVINGFKIITVELTKKDKCVKKKIRRWLDLLTSKRLDTFIGDDDEMNETVSSIVKINNDPKTMDMLEQLEELKRLEYVTKAAQEEKFQLREKQAIERGMKKGIEQGIQQGIEQGIQQGIQQGIEQGIQQGIERGSLEKTIAIVKKLKAIDMSIEEIANVTGLSIEDVKNL